VVSPPPDVSSPLHHYLLASLHNGRFALSSLSPRRCCLAGGMDEQGLDDGFTGAARSCRATTGGTRCCSYNSSTTSSDNGWRRQRRRYGSCSRAWHSRGRCGTAIRQTMGTPSSRSARSGPRWCPLDPCPLMLHLPQGFSPSPPPCPAYGMMRMSDAKPHISFVSRFTDRAIIASFNEVAPSSPLPPGRVPFSPIAYVIQFDLPPAVVGGPNPSSPQSQ
jgi:hypothetical protein